VVDSSVVLKWFVHEPQREAAVSLRDPDNTLVAPDLVFAEVTNALWRKVRKNEVQPVQVTHAISEMSSMLVVRPIDPQMTSVAFAIARELEHSIYDCLFLACAREEEADLVTADQKFLAKLTNTAFATHVRALTS
jgi:predicted nucleic acid-binding protein